MNDPALYRTYDKLPRNDTKEMLEKHASKIKWKNLGDRVLDIGSADGGVTTELLKKYLPANYSKLMGCDISPTMVKYAKQHYRDERTSFMVLDIQDNLLAELKGGFDHVFSFYVLHWIQKQNKAMNNIYNMLSEGGDCLLFFLGYSDLFATYRIMARHPKWAPWLTNAELYISPYQDSEEPENEFRMVMEKAGFKNIEVSSQRKSYLYTNIEYAKGLIASVSPFDIPKELLKEYLNDYVETAVKNNLMERITYNPFKPPGISYSYVMITAYGSK